MPSDKMKRSQYAKTRYMWLKNRHICVNCGHHKARPRKTKCAICAGKSNLYMRQKYHEKKGGEIYGTETKK